MCRFLTILLVTTLVAEARAQPANQQLLFQQREETAKAIKLKPGTATSEFVAGQRQRDTGVKTMVIGGVVGGSATLAGTVLAIACSTANDPDDPLSRTTADCSVGPFVTVGVIGLAVMAASMIVGGRWVHAGRRRMLNAGNRFKKVNKRSKRQPKIAVSLPGRFALHWSF